MRNRRPFGQRLRRSNRNVLWAPWLGGGYVRTRPMRTPWRAEPSMTPCRSSDLPGTSRVRPELRSWGSLSRGAIPWHGNTCPSPRPPFVVVAAGPICRREGAPRHLAGLAKKIIGSTNGGRARTRSPPSSVSAPTTLPSAGTGSPTGPLRTEAKPHAMRELIGPTASSNPAGPFDDHDLHPRAGFPKTSSSAALRLWSAPAGWHRPGSLLPPPW
jgi:hypothetical protein